MAAAQLGIRLAPAWPRQAESSIMKRTHAFLAATMALRLLAGMAAFASPDHHLSRRVQDPVRAGLLDRPARTRRLYPGG